MGKNRSKRPAGLLGLTLLLLALSMLPSRKNIADNPFVTGEGELPMIVAHRGGSRNNPENTMLAFREAVQTIGAQVIECDLQLTKDGYLVCNHDSYVDRTCNINGDMSRKEVEQLCREPSERHYIGDMTLLQLQQYNFGYYFEDARAERIYKDASNIADMGLQIITLEQLFAEFYHRYPDLLFILEIKNGGSKGIEACRILCDILRDYPDYADQVVVASFNNDVQAWLHTNCPDMLRCATCGVAARFVIGQCFGANILDRSNFACLLIPDSYNAGLNIPLDTPLVVESAHRRNVAVQYWTINDADEMHRLIELGADSIVTDDPEMLKRVLAQYR